MSTISIVERSQVFILELQKQQDCSQDSHFREEGQKIYNELIQWIPENKRNEEFDEVVCLVFSLLIELQRRNGLSEKMVKDLSEKAITVIETTQGEEIQPDLVRFLKQQHSSLVGHHLMT